MDSGSTALAIVLAGSVLAFLGLHAAEAALPLLRRSAVRDWLPERGVREAAVRRLRSSRNAYEDLVWLLVLLSAAAVSASALGLLMRLWELHWAAVAAVLAGLWLVLLLLAPLAEYTAGRLPTRQLVTFGTIVQVLLWPLLPVRRFSRSGLRFAGAHQDGERSGNGHAETTEAALDVEEEIADEPLDHHEREMIRAILHLDETPVREIMVPRVDVVSIEVSTSIERAATRMLDSGHSRLPVYETDPDNIVGMLYSRDLLAATANRAAAPALSDLVRPPFFVPESKRVDEMLTEFQERRVHMAVVVDEYGGISGIVTVEDLIEEIVGEIEDEFDTGQPNVEWAANGDAVVDARMSVDEFNGTFGAAVAAEGFDTVGGLLFSRLGKIPSSGDVVEENGLEVRVMTTIGRRVKRVRVTRAADPALANGGSA